ncbi:hypothetical protein Rhe02_61420 [Rhizocola hellebori]|uniref:Uncharacterized protein n=2 Tax=Rhizocola hellebori TaxID=1392758 RepID=A0A8J3QEE2_9ACTN|nr:hypothetical protein Rhe02_61420 [Rhizocola hellebori]
MAMAVLAAAALGAVAAPVAAQAGDTWGSQNCTLYSFTATRGAIQCYIGSWRARVKVDCYKFDGTYTARYGSYVDVGTSSATCPSGYEAGEVYAQYNQGPTKKLT